jgi:hypothetical protein
MEVVGCFLVDGAIAFQFVLLSVEGSLILLILFSSHVSRLDIGLHSLEASTDGVTGVNSSVLGSIGVELSSIFTVSARAVRSSSTEELLFVLFESSGCFHVGGNISSWVL